MRKCLIFTLAAIVQTGCQSTAVLNSAQKEGVGDYEIVSTPLDYQHHVVYIAGKRQKLCHSPSRGALVGSSSSLGLSGDGTSVTASGGVSDSLVGGRRDATFISSEIMYRVCEFIQNTDLTQDEETALFNKALEYVSRIGVAAAKTPATTPDTDEEDSSE
jgi:hypothetical protein